MKASNRVKKNILEFRNIREDIIGKTAIEDYYEYLTNALEINDLPIIVCNTLEKRTSFVEAQNNQFFLIFDNYIIELFHLMNQFVLWNDLSEDIEAFFYKIASEECYIRLQYKTALHFAGQYLNKLDNVLFRINKEDSLKPLSNYLFAQQAFLVAHELCHFWTRVSFKSERKYIDAKKKALYNVYEYAKRNHDDVSDVLLSGLKSKNIYEECLCDSIGLIQSIAIGTKLKDMKALECSNACLVALMNLCILSTIALIIQNAGVIFYEEMLNKYNLRINQLKIYTSKYLREYFTTNDAREYEDAAEDITHKWLFKVIDPIIELGIKNIENFDDALEEISNTELLKIKSVLKQTYQL